MAIKKGPLLDIKATFLEIRLLLKLHDFDDLTYPAPNSQILSEKQFWRNGSKIARAN